MAQKVEFELVVKTNDSVKEVEQLNKKVKEVEKSSRKTNKELSGGAQIGKEAIRGLDRQTSGLATKLVAVGKAAKLSGKAMKTALISSGIGLAVVALGLIVEHWDKIAGLINGVSGDQKDILASTEETLVAQEKQLSATNSMESTLKLQGKTEKEIRDLKRQQTNEIITSTELLLEQQQAIKKTQVEAAERNQKITAGIVSFLSLPITMLLGAVDALTFGLAKLGIIEEATSLAEDAAMGIAGLLFDPEEVSKEGDAVIEETENKLRKLKNTRDSFLLQDKADKEKEKEKTKVDDKVEVDPEVAKKAKALEEITKLEDEYIQSQLDKKTQEENLVSDKYFNLLEKARLYGEDTALLEEAQAAELLEIKDRYAAIDKENADKQLEDAQKIADTKKDLQMELVGQVGNAVGAIGDIFEKGTAASKGAALAEIAIGTGIGFINALDIAQKSAKGTGPAAAFAFPIFYASQIAAVLGAVSQAKNILSTVKGGGSGGSVSAPSQGTTAPQAPSFNVVGSSGTNQLASAIGGQSQQPVKAFVVSNDVTTSQELERNIISNASIG